MFIVIKSRDPLTASSIPGLPINEIEKMGIAGIPARFFERPPGQRVIP